MLTWYKYQNNWLIIETKLFLSQALFCRKTKSTPPKNIHTVRSELCFGVVRCRVILAKSLRVTLLALGRLCNWLPQCRTGRISLDRTWCSQEWLSNRTQQNNILCIFELSDKMAAIFHTTFSNAFSWMKMFKFRLRFHWSLFPRVQLTIFHHWFR